MSSAENRAELCRAGRAPPADAVPGQSEVWSNVLASLIGRPGRMAAQLAVLGAVVGGGVAYANAGKSVLLSVDGTTVHVSTVASTVGDLLSQEGIAVSTRDLVAPAVTQPLTDGGKVIVRYARPLTVMVDGHPRTIWTTELRVGDALRALGIRSEGAALSASRSAPLGRRGLTMTMTTLKSVLLVVAGRPVALSTTQPTVYALLASRGLTLQPLDTVSVPLDSRLTSGMTVQVRRIVRQRVEAVEAVPHGTVTRRAPTLATGQTRVLTPGRDGTRVAVYDTVVTDGRVTARTLVSARLVQPAMSELVAVGTKQPRPASRPPAAASPAVPHSGAGAGLNWAALARCESGGNPRAVSSNGLYYGLYQFSASTWGAVGGHGLPSNASPAEQTARAQILYSRSGAGQWPVCGRRLFS